MIWGCDVNNLLIIGCTHVPSEDLLLGKHLRIQSGARLLGPELAGIGVLLARYGDSQMLVERIHRGEVRRIDGVADDDPRLRP